MLMSVVVFLFISTSVIVGVSSPILKQSLITKNFLTSRSSYFLAEAGIEDTIYRLKNNKKTTDINSVFVGDNGTDISITTLNNKKTVISQAYYDDLVRKVETVIKAGTGSSFSYGIQSGAGGFTLGENTTVNGSVYATGQVIGSNHAKVTGAAVSSNSASLVADQINNTPSDPSYSITFGNVSANQDVAESFKVSNTNTLNKISVYIKKNSNPSNLVVRITADDSGKPSNDTIVYANLDNSLITSEYGWADVSLPNYVQLIAGATYWLVLDGGTNAGKYYIIGANDSYINGQAKVGQYGGAWSDTAPAGLDIYFKIYTGGVTGLIDTLEVGSGGVGNAEAYQIKNSTVAGTIYCQVGSNNNKTCDTTKPVPSPLDFPISDAVIALWKSEAEAGGVINGDYTLTSSMSLGPKKIVGDLKIDGNKTLTMTGNIWVTGNIELENGAIVKLDTGYISNGGLLMADGDIDISNGASFAGSGQSGSYIMVLSTSDCPQSPSCDGNYAIDVANNVGAVIINAEKGTIRMRNNVGVKAATAYRIIFDNNSIINYETGLADVNFVNGPGGSWSVESWREIQ